MPGDNHTSIDSSRRFYETQVAPLIHKRYAEYEDRIAVGIAGEGSDCFGYDDLISRDHDFGTGVCLWVTEEDMEEFGYLLSLQYNELAARCGGAGLTDRLKSRRGVMTVKDFYSNILGVNCDVSSGSLSHEQWMELDHNCLATAVNGEVFRDDLGMFSSFRKMLLDYYPDDVWKIRIVDELHRFSLGVQVNYARCMTRGDVVAAELCREEGLQSAMQLFFLMKRQYAPYYKWTFRRLSELDNDGEYSALIRSLSSARGDIKLWQGRPYEPDNLNTDDPVVNSAEQIAKLIREMMTSNGLISPCSDNYLERYVDEILRGITQ